jgi:hypothetical protein
VYLLLRTRAIRGNDASEAGRDMISTIDADVRRSNTESMLRIRPGVGAWPRTEEDEKLRSNFIMEKEVQARAFTGIYRATIEFMRRYAAAHRVAAAKVGVGKTMVRRRRRVDERPAPASPNLTCRS